MLHLSSLIRRFRVEVESGQVPLETSAKTLSYASELVAFKLKCLLPSARDAALDDEVQEYGVDETATTLIPVMEPWELSQAVRWMTRAFSVSDKMLSRGATMLAGASPEAIVVSLDAAELVAAMGPMLARSRRSSVTLAVPRFSFLSHLRSFWSEIRRLTRQGVVLRFSRFLGKSKSEAVLNFLAFLELVRRRRVFARQIDSLGDIVFSTAKEKVIEYEEVQDW
ncbi:MAG: hypothetical protein ACOX3V_01770 [Bacillota bacterium]